MDKVWLDLLDGLHEGLVPGLLPTGGPGALAQVRGPPNTPPNRLEAASNAPETFPNAQAWNWVL
ncbi:MAG: hypothetical protein M5U11_09600 [Anaerolineales bacterium]|nr:hypothetical protein [Anaerolineales bacterium]